MPDGTGLDGECSVCPIGQPAPSSSTTLQSRIGRKTVAEESLLPKPRRAHAYIAGMRKARISRTPFADRRFALLNKPAPPCPTTHRSACRRS